MRVCCWATQRLQDPRRRLLVLDRTSALHLDDDGRDDHQQRDPEPINGKAGRLSILARGAFIMLRVRGIRVRFLEGRGFCLSRRRRGVRAHAPRPSCRGLSVCTRSFHHSTHQKTSLARSLDHAGDSGAVEMPAILAPIDADAPPRARSPATSENSDDGGDDGRAARGPPPGDLNGKKRGKW